VPHLLHRRLADLEGAESALVLASGRAAVACTALALLRPGDHLLSSMWLRPETRHFFAHELPALGVDVTYVDPRETRGWRRGLSRTTRALYVESPVLESGRLLDLRPPRTLTQELGLALIVDATAASPVNFTPIAHGVDIVLHDATLFLDGHGQGEAGVVAGTEGLVEEVRLKMETWGALPHPLARVQLDNGLATLEVRVQRQNSTAQQLAEWAEGHADVSDVLYAGLASHPDRSAFEEWFKGAGATVHLRLRNEAQHGQAHDIPQIAAHASALLAGAPGARNVITHIAPGGETGWLRIHVGLESAHTIIAALVSAISAPSSYSR
jgi:cystathionine beta-lyase/cystathionine gamma-synthase